VKLGFGRWIVRVQDGRHLCELWNQLLEQLHSLGPDFGIEEALTGDITAWPRHIRDNARRNWITDKRHDDGDCCRCLFGGEASRRGRVTIRSTLARKISAANSGSRS
jgi:hypothetical protein